jgi:hypothetical protein
MSVLRSVIGVHGRTSMRRHCLSSRRGGPALWCERQLFCPSRAMLLFALSGSPLFGGSVHMMRSVFSSQRRCNLRSGLSPLWGWTKFATCAVTLRDPKRDQARSAVAIGHFRVA